MSYRFGIDIDGTVTCPTTFVSYLNESFHVSLNYNDLTQYELAPLVGITDREFWEWMNEKEPIIYAHSPIAKDADKVLNAWKAEHQLIYISARREHLLDITRNWFLINKISFDKIDLVGSHDKLTAVKHHKIHLFFEDKHDNACSISEECGIPVLLFNTPYNQQPTPKNVFRVNNWLEAKQWVQDWQFTNK